MAADNNFLLANERMDRMQTEVNQVRDLMTRHIEMDKPGR